MPIQEGTEPSPSNTYVTITTMKDFKGEKKFQEIFEEANTTRNQVCPVRDIIARISDKWSILALCALGGYGTMRFNEIKHKIGDVSQRMLTVTLRNLEKDGFVTRQVYPEIPPRVEYRLTALGYELIQQLSKLTDWASANCGLILESRKKAA